MHSTFPVNKIVYHPTVDINWLSLNHIFATFLSSVSNNLEQCNVDYHKVDDQGNVDLQWTGINIYYILFEQFLIKYKGRQVVR